MNDVTIDFAAGRSRILDAKSEPLTAGGDSSHDSSSYSLSSDNDQLSCNIELKPKPEKPKRFRKRKCHFHDFKQSLPQLVRDGAEQVKAESCRVEKQRPIKFLNSTNLPGTRVMGVAVVAKVLRANFCILTIVASSLKIFTRDLDFRCQSQPSGWNLATESAFTRSEA